MVETIKASPIEDSWLRIKFLKFLYDTNSSIKVLDQTYIIF